MNRRRFLRTASLTASWAAPTVMLTSLFAHPAMCSPDLPAHSAPELHPVSAGADRFGSLHSLGFSDLAFKVGTQESGGNLFVIEHRGLKPGGPPLHLHYNQEEWFYVVEGRVTFIVGEKKLTLGPGESILAPRRIPHTFSSVVPSSHLLIGFAPACKMEQYFADAHGNGKLAAQPEYMNRYDMQWVGPSPFKKA